MPLLAQLCGVVLAAEAAREVPSFLSKQRQPARCGFIKCNSFSSECGTDQDCVTDKCYEGQCGNAPQCRPAGQLCYPYAQHTCCTGECKPVVLRKDCLRLLKSLSKFEKGVGLNVEKLCGKLGVCKSWPGSPNIGPLSTPWAVPYNDFSSKYTGIKGITFAGGTKLRTDLFIARRVGQTFKDVDAGSTQPQAIQDAGLIFFDEGSKIDSKKAYRFQEGKDMYCVAPILKDGLGGGFYAVGKNCCPSISGAFTCGDAIFPEVKSALVIDLNQDKYMQAVKLVDQNYGHEFHPDGGASGGVQTPQPLLVRIVKDWQTERADPEMGYKYIPEAAETHCVAPVWNDDNVWPAEVEFWAAGTNCCAYDGDNAGFHCDDADKSTAHSGKYLDDSSGIYKTTAIQAGYKFGAMIPKKGIPMFLTWTDEVMVPDPTR